jgi:hypothetical protein
LAESYISNISPPSTFQMAFRRSLDGLPPRYGERAA